MAATWPLTGRAEELSLIGGLLQRRDGPLGVVLAGAAGVGKTRLAREALAVAQQRGARTRWAAATASARAWPLGAFAAMLGVVGPDPARLLRQASAALLAGAGRAGVIVGVDDAHLLDELSATLVHQLVLGRAASVVLTRPIPSWPHSPSWPAPTPSEPKRPFPEWPPCFLLSGVPLRPK